MNRLFTPLLTRGQRIKLFLAILPSILVLLPYLYWWFDPSHHVSLLFSLGASYIVCYEIHSPFWLYFFVFRSVKPNSKTFNPPLNGKVAMVVTKAPSEPWERVKITLRACLEQELPSNEGNLRPFAVWLADESPTKETLEWCRENGVKVCSRRDNQDYHQMEWPRKTKCKEGNLAYFYDKAGYARYDFVVQLDCDHIPRKGYLKEMLVPFNDPEIGYVAAPSICSLGSDKSWFARGRLWAEGPLHGVQQAGHGNMFAPLAIGSHYAVRTQALKQIGGLGPELAEDHSTSLLMNAGGWRGAFSINAIAHGDGPATVADGITQEFQWSRSVMILFLTLLPKKIFHLKPHILIQFIYSELWYPSFSLVAIIGFLLTWTSLLTDNPVMRMNYIWFIGFNIAYILTSLLPKILLRKWGVFRPYNAPVLSWEEALFNLTRLPWVIIGLCSAIKTVVSRKRGQVWKVTPKGKGNASALPNRILSPYLVITILTCAIVICTHQVEYTRGYHTIALITCLWALLTALTIVVLHPKKQPLQVIAVFLTSILLIITSGLRLPASIAALNESRLLSVTRFKAIEQVLKGQPQPTPPSHTINKR